MRLTRISLILLVVLLGGTGLVHAQGATAVPFLAIPVSPEQNGMGGVTTAVPSEHSMSPVGNPAQLGFFSMGNFLSAGLYAPKVDWLPQYNISGLTFNTVAVNAGLNLSSLIDVPFPISVGVGYSDIFLNLGTFTIMSPGGPSPAGTFIANEESQEFSVGLGFTYFVTVGIGVGFKAIESNLSPIGTEREQGSGSAKTTATDFGMMLQVPVPEIASSLGAGSMEIFTGIEPMLDLNLGFARSNLGGSMTYVDPAQADPLPRKANVGASFKLGLKTAHHGVPMELAGFTLAREAEQLLVERFPDGTWEYTPGFGQIRFGENVLAGNSSEVVGSRKGWQLQFAEFFAVRAGSFDQQGIGYTTSGYGIRLSGLLKGILYIVPESVEGTWFEWVVRSIDLGFDHSEQTAYGSGSGNPNRSFNSLNLVIRTLPF